VQVDSARTRRPPVGVRRGRRADDGYGSFLSHLLQADWADGQKGRSTPTRFPGAKLTGSFTTPYSLGLPW
jgi:hypothetical protein